MFTCTTWWQLFSKSVLDVLYCRVTAFNKLLNSQVIACIRWAKCVCVCSDSRNDVPRVAQRYGTIAAHTRRRSSVLVVYVVFCVHMYRFAGFDKADATADIQWHCNYRPPLWYHYIPGCGYPGLLDRKIVQTCAKKTTLGFKGHADNNRVRKSSGETLRSQQNTGH